MIVIMLCDFNFVNDQNIFYGFFEFKNKVMKRVFLLKYKVEKEIKKKNFCSYKNIQLQVQWSQKNYDTRKKKLYAFKLKLN